MKQEASARVASEDVMNDKTCGTVSTLLLNLLNWYNLSDLSDEKRHVDPPWLDLSAK